MKPIIWPPNAPKIKGLIALLIVLLFLALILPYTMNFGPIVQEPTWEVRILHKGIITESFTYTDTWQNGPTGYYFKMQEGNDTKCIKVSEDAFHRFHVNDTYRFFEDEIVRDPRPAPYRGDWDVHITSSTKNLTISWDSIVLYTIGYNRTTGNMSSLNITFDVYISRIDTWVCDSVTSVRVQEIGTVVSNNITYDIIAKNPDGTYQAEWLDNNNHTFNMEIILPYEASDRYASSTINIGINPEAIRHMSDYETSLIQLVIGGQYIDLYVMMIPYKEAQP